MRDESLDERMMRELLAKARELPVVDTAEFKRVVSDRIDVLEQGNSREKRDYSGVSLRGWSRWAIGFGALIFCVFTVEHVSKETTFPTNTSKTYVTQPGQRATVTLADGSTAILAPATTIHAKGRNIELAGEAVFTVNYNNSSPFIVSAGGTKTRVLGTVFSVRRYAEDTVTKIVVAQGKVIAAQTVLASGQAGVSKKDGSVILDPKTDLESALSWSTGQLILKTITMRSAIPELERWFNVKIHLTSPSLLDSHIRIVLQNESPVQAFALISEAINARAHWDGNNVTFQPLSSQESRL